MILECPFLANCVSCSGPFSCEKCEDGFYPNALGQCTSILVLNSP